MCVAVDGFSQKKNVIMYIGDGYGLAPKTAARLALGQGQPGSRYSDDPNFRLLAADRMRYQATVTVHSYNGFITDSAPGATCYAAGKNGKIDNDAIAWDPLTQAPVETILEAAKKQGYAVGLVTSTRITHATPADFAAHTWSRSLEDVIAAQYLASTQEEYAALLGEQYDTLVHWLYPAVKEGVELDVVMGGGARHFYPSDICKPIVDSEGNQINDNEGNPVCIPGRRRSDSRDLVEYATENLGFEYVNSRDALMKLDLDSYANSDKKLLGLFTASHTTYEQERQISKPWEPALWEMTQVAIEVLKRKSDKGFFLIVEGGRIDHMEHANVGSVVLNDTGDAYKVVAEEEAFQDPDAIYGIRGDNPTAPTFENIYGSDYLIKEVLDFDYAIEEGRKLMADNSMETLLFQSSDHECGGLTIVGLHDSEDKQGNGTMIRTYAERPSNSLGGSNAQPGMIERGDDEFDVPGWFPDYELYEFQGQMWPQPTGPDARRMVISFGSNPITNGNGAFGTPGNHTPQDIWVGGDDNVGGAYASQITGRGLLDNTDLTPIMADFLGLDDFSTFNVNAGITIETDETYCDLQPTTMEVKVRNTDISAGSDIMVQINRPFNARLIDLDPGENGRYRNNVWTISNLPVGETATLTMTFLATSADTPLAIGASFMKNADPATVAAAVAPAGACANLFDFGDVVPVEETAVFPNPTTDLARIQFDSQLEGNATVELFDMSGKRLDAMQTALIAGRNIVDLNVANYENGTYLVHIKEDGGESKVATIVKK